MVVSPNDVLGTLTFDPEFSPSRGADHVRGCTA
jgi:hypothetical protein